MYKKTIMKVKIECFKTLLDFHNNSIYRKGNGKAGVYIWGFSLEKQDFTVPTLPQMFFPYYVGKHYKDIYSRTHEHLAYLSGGNYSIFDILQCSSNGTKIGIEQRKYQTASKNSKPASGPVLPTTQFSNMLYFPEGVHRQNDFFFDGLISKQINWMLRHFCILYINPIGNFSSSDIDNLEKTIGQLIDYERLITKSYKNIPEDFKVEIVYNSIIIPLEKCEDLFNYCKNIELTNNK